MFFYLFFCRLARMNPDCGQHFRKNTFAVQTPRIELSERKDHFPGRPEFPPCYRIPVKPDRRFLLQFSIHSII